MRSKNQMPKRLVNVIILLRSAFPGMSINNALVKRAYAKAGWDITKLCTLTNNEVCQISRDDFFLCIMDGFMQIILPPSWRRRSRMVNLGSITMNLHSALIHSLLAKFERISKHNTRPKLPRSSPPRPRHFPPLAQKAKKSKEWRNF